MKHSGLWSTIAFALVILSSITGSTADKRSSKCEFENVGYTFIPKTICQNENQIFDNFGCLMSDGRLASHCKKENWCHSKCDANGIEKYACRDFKICVEPTSVTSKIPEDNSLRKSETSR